MNLPVGTNDFLLTIDRCDFQKIVDFQQFAVLSASNGLHSLYNASAVDPKTFLKNAII